MSTIEELLQDWQATDILEHWDYQTTMQPYRNIHTGMEMMVYIIKCEVCRTPLWLNFHKADNGLLHNENKLTDTCACDEAEADNWGHDNNCPLSPCICDAGEEPTHITDVENYSGWAHTNPDED